MADTDTPDLSDETDSGDVSVATDHAPLQLLNETTLTMALFVLLGGILFAVYGRALASPLFFDDMATIVNNPSIVRLWPLVGDAVRPGPLNPPANLPTAGRPLVNLSFALNYYFSKLSPVGFHASNVLLHLLSAILLAAIVRRTLRLDYFGGRFASVAWPLSMAVAFVWALHPLQSEAVIYATQRTELLVGFFYLATLYNSLRYWTAVSPAGRTTWLVLATLSCLAGMASKEVMVSAPIVVLLFERTFLAGSFRQTFRRSWPLYVGLATGWLLLLALNANAPRSDTAGFHLDVPGYVWWYTQTEVLIMYLKLAVWPHPLVIHYGPNYLLTAGAAMPWLLPVVLMAIGTLVLLWRNRPLGFLAAWMWLILAPTLIVPILTEVAAERRMYLPLAALVTALFVGGYQLATWAQAAFFAGRRDDAASRWPMTASLAVAVVLCGVYCVVSARRASLYANELALWQHAVLYEADDPLVQNGAGLALLAANQPEDAIEHFKRALQVRPDYAKASNNWGAALLQLNKPEEAVALFEEALKVKPDYAAAHNGLGQALLKLNRTQEAIDHFNQAMQWKPNDPETRCNIGNQLATAGRYEEAAEQFRQALRINPDYPPAHNNLGSALLKLDRHPEAIAEFQEALRLQPENAEANYNLGSELIAAGHPQEAVPYFERAIRLKPDYAEAHNNLGGALAAVGKFPEAIAHCREAVRLKPDFDRALINLGTTLVHAGKSQEAIEPLRRAIELKPDSVEAHGALAKALVNTRQFPEAIEQCQEVLRLKPDDADANHTYGAALLNSGQPQEAIKRFEETLRVKPDDADAIYNVGNALASMGQLQDAIDHFERAARLKPNDPEMQNNWGGILLGMNRAAESVEHFEQALKLNPSYPDARNNLGSALIELKRPQDAIGQLKLALTLKPDYVEAWANAADALSQIGQTHEAIQAAEKGLELARAQNKADFAQEIESRLAKYRAAESAASKQPEASKTPTPSP